MSGGTPEADSWPAFAARERVRRQREIDELHARYGDLYERITAILFRHDPVGLNFDDNTDEYAPEARRIAWVLSTLSSVDEARRTIRDIFAASFDDRLAGPESRYQRAAEDIWGLWERR